ncbi:hypothetical protein N035_000850 [Klebsiella pneumoniae EGD-HP19-C]|nr:hypothetical protein N035_000850 [Klebsiella pneumoniae EGD-HP19-C]
MLKKEPGVLWPAFLYLWNTQVLLVSWLWMKMIKSLILLKNLLILLLCRGIKPNRLPVWGSMYLMLNTSISYWMKMVGMNSPATISAKILFQQLRYPEKPGHILSRAPVCRQIIMQNRTGVMSELWRPTGKRTLI